MISLQHCNKCIHKKVCINSATYTINVVQGIKHTLEDTNYFTLKLTCNNYIEVKAKKKKVHKDVTKKPI